MLMRIGQFVTRGYGTYFRRPQVRSMHFWITTGLFLLAQARAIRLVVEFWPQIPAVLHIRIAILVVCLPLPWVMMLREHATLSRVLPAESPSAAGELNSSAEVAKTVLFIVSFSYFLLFLALGLSFRLLG